MQAASSFAPQNVFFFGFCPHDPSQRTHCFLFLLFYPKVFLCGNLLKPAWCCLKQSLFRTRLSAPCFSRGIALGEVQTSSELLNKADLLLWVEMEFSIDLKLAPVEM